MGLKAIYVPLGAPKIGHRRRTTKFTARDLKFGILLPGGPQTPTSMSKSFLTPGRSGDTMFHSTKHKQLELNSYYFYKAK